MPGGFRESPLRLNKGLGALDKWDEKTIDARASRLAEAALQVWRAPQLPSEVLEMYKPSSKPSARPVYTINDHHHLAAGSMARGLFDQFRKEVMALDPCVAEEFLKLYVAFKAETNFVDVIPQASRLLLSLNVPFPELHDPRSIARDVTDLGRWGNGDSEVTLQSIDEIPYVIGLVRQAFERQMGNGLQEEFS
jgi:predicted transport protein